MSASKQHDARTFLRLKHVLRRMEDDTKADNVRALAFYATIFRIDAVELKSFLARYNDGAKEIAPGKIEQLTRELGAVKPLTGAWVADYDAGVAPSDEALDSFDAAVAPPPAPAVVAEPKPTAPKLAPRNTVAERPWLKHKRMPTAKAVANHRATLLAIAAGRPVEKSGAFYMFAKFWLGTATLAPETINAFLAWFDGEQTPAAPTPPPPAMSSRSQVVAAIGGNRGDKTEAINRELGRSIVAASAETSDGGDGWLSIAPPQKRVADLRYAGARVAAPNLSFRKVTSKRLALRDKACFTVRFNPTAGLLALVPAPAGTGYPLHEQRSGIRLVSNALAGLLGEKPRLFTEAVNTGALAAMPKGTLFFAEVQS